MLNKKTNERELAYIVRISETRELPGYDNVHYVHVNGWWCVAQKTMQTGDLAIYFEIDSILPRDDNRFAFMEKRNYRVRTQKMCKVVSQGLALPLTSFPELKHAKEGDFVTERLSVKLFEESIQEQQQKTKADGWSKAQDRHKKFFKNPVVKYLMRYSAVRWLLKKLFIKKKDKIKWPEWLPKTGSERVQNLPVLFECPETRWVASEKVDGMSSSYVLDEKGAYLVCSHNVVVFSSKVKGSENIANGNTYIKQNVWLLMSEKYNMKQKLETLKAKRNAKSVAIQGEVYGDRVQKRTYGLKNRQDLAVFHIWIDGNRLSMKDTQVLCQELCLPMVHVFDWELHIPSTVEALISRINSEHSAIDGGMIEGYVLYSQDGFLNYKCVSPLYLLKYH